MRAKSKRTSWRGARVMEEERIGNAACSFTVIEVVPVGRCPTGCERVCSIFDARACVLCTLYRGPAHMKNEVRTVAPCDRKLRPTARCCAAGFSLKRSS